MTVSVAPCPYSDVRIPCESCNRQFRSRACFDRHKTTKIEKKTYVKIRGTVPRVINSYRIKGMNVSSHTVLSGRNKEIDHFCFMQPLKNELPRSFDVLFVFYDFETTQDTKFSENATEHIPLLVCAQQFCTACEILDIEMNCERCGRRRHSFYDDPVGDLSL